MSKKRHRWYRRKGRTEHHAPPKSTRTPWFGKLLVKSENQHIAFHILFGAPRDLEECIKILKRDWWPSEK